jgi:hypothetical protein
MGFRLDRFLFTGFAAVVLLSQNLSLGYCNHSSSFFVTECPCSEDSCPCENCDDKGCPPFLVIQLDDFIEGELPSFPVPGEFALVERDHDSHFLPEFHPTHRIFQLIKPPPPEVSLLLQYSIALI